MKKIIAVLLATMMTFSLAACSETHNSSTDTPDENIPTTEVQNNGVSNNDSSDETLNTPMPSVQTKDSPDKYTWYVKDYIGKNCAALGYTSLGGDRMDRYGSGLLELIFVCADGTYVDISSDDALKEYAVIGQSLSPNTELKYIFDKDNEGNEYDNLIAHQNHEKIVLNVKKVGSSDSPLALTSITPSPDKYTWYVADYVGRNLASCGYISLGGNLMDTYGAAYIKLCIVADDGSYIDSSDAALLKCYVVTGQNIAPNTELTLSFDKDSDGVEYDNLVETQNIEEIELYVKRIPGVEPSYTIEETAAPTAESENQESHLSADNSNTETIDGLRPEFKEAMDAYENFYTEYYDFLKEYTANPTDLALLAKYEDMVERAEEMDEAFEAWDDDDLNSDELKYYLEVTNRVIQNMIDVTG